MPEFKDILFFIGIIGFMFFMHRKGGMGCGGTAHGDHGNDNPNDGKKNKQKQPIANKKEVTTKAHK